MCVAGLTSFDFIVVTTLFETLTKNDGILQKCFAEFTLFKTVCTVKFSKIDASTLKLFLFSISLKQNDIFGFDVVTLSMVPIILQDEQQLETRIYLNKCRILGT